MNWQYTPYVLPLCVSAAISAALSLVAWRRRDTPGAVPIASFMVAAAIWSIAYALELGSVSLAANLFWLKVKYVGVVIAPTAWLVFVLQYTGRGSWLSRRNLRLLAVEPLLTLLLVWTSDLHHLYHTTHLDRSGAFPALQVAFGPGFWGNWVYSYLLMAGATWLIIKAYLAHPRPGPYRGQIGAMLVGAAMPWLGNALYMAGLSPILDPTPMAFSLTGLAVAWGLFRFRLLDIVPVARNAVIENMDDGVIVLDRQNRIVDLNPAAARIIARPASELIGRPAAGVLPGWTSLIERPAGAAQARREITLPHTDASAERWFDLHLSPLYDRRRRLTGRLMVLHDITGRKQAEARERRLLDRQIAINQLALALGDGRDLEELYHVIHRHLQELLDPVIVTISFYDPVSQLIHAGYSISDKTVFDVASLPPVPLEPEGHGTQSRVIRSGKPLYIPDFGEATMSTQTQYGVDEELRSVTEASPTADSDEDQVRSAMIVPMQVAGNVIGVLQVQSHRLDAYTQEDLDVLAALANVAAVAIQNVRLLEGSRQQAQQMQDILQTVPEGVILLDATGKIMLANPVAQDYLSVLAGVKVGDSLSRLAGRPLAELLITPARGLWHELARDDHTFEMIARPIELGPQPAGSVLVIRDVTEEREAQQRIQRQDRLAAIGQLAAGIAHDFNNIMAVITLYTDFLIRSEASGVALERLKTVKLQARRAADLIDQILDFSRRSVLRQRTLDLEPFLKELVELLRRTLEESIRIDLSITPEEHVIHADPTRIQQALMNLAINARDAMFPHGGGVLRISLERTRVCPGESPPLAIAAGEWVKLEVADSGSGMPAETVAHIYEPFFTTKGPGQGTGLGLAQVWGIVQQHKGHIDVASKVGVGTTFTIHLPALGAGRLEAVADETSAVPEGNGESILVVEDDATLREAIAVSLADLNYRVLQAAHGQEALDLIEHHPGRIELVLTDLVMPQMGGLALAHALKRTYPSIKVIAMTGHPLRSDEMELKAAGVVACLEKPARLEQLAHEIARALSPTDMAGSGGPARN